jgi:hypothetical protein
MHFLSHFIVIIDSIVGTGYLEDDKRRGCPVSGYGEETVPGDTN